MPDFVTLSCPSCGGKLQITEDIDRFACSYCGAEQIVRRGGGIVTLSPVVEGLRQVQVGVDKTASELAIKRIRGDIETLKSQRQNILNELQYESNVFAIFFIIVGVFIGFLGFSTSWLFFFAAFFIIPGLLSLLEKKSSNDRIRAERENLFTKVDTQIASKTAELRQHEKIVSTKSTK